MYLSQKSSGYEPKTVVDAELVLHHVVLNNTEEQNPMFHFDNLCSDVDGDSSPSS